MSFAAEACQRAKEIREKLRHPPNAVIDEGIDLKRRPLPPVPQKPQFIGGKLKRIHIVNALAVHFRIKVPDLLGKCRRPPLVLPRHIAIYLTKRYFPSKSGASIARDFNKDHTTALHACQKIQKLVDNSDPVVLAAIKATEEILFGHYRFQPPLAAINERIMERREGTGLSLEKISVVAEGSGTSMAGTEAQTES